MGFAKDYGIPRAVMYDGPKDAKNPMFDLNRDIMAEQKDVIVITQENYEETGNNITQNKLLKKTNLLGVQSRLF